MTALGHLVEEGDEVLTGTVAHPSDVHRRHEREDVVGCFWDRPELRPELVGARRDVLRGVARAEYSFFEEAEHAFAECELAFSRAHQMRAELAADVLLGILGWLPWWDVVACAHVCRHWRRVVLENASSVFRWCVVDDRPSLVHLRRVLSQRWFPGDAVHHLTFTGEATAMRVMFVVDWCRSIQSVNAVNTRVTLPDLDELLQARVRLHRRFPRWTTLHVWSPSNHLQPIRHLHAVLQSLRQLNSDQPIACDLTVCAACHRYLATSRGCAVCMA
ncbi:MAG TPA: F-box protein [Armatimonadota bacterium]|nr:F-box protein [Armatimonadota bacterium]